MRLPQGFSMAWLTLLVLMADSATGLAEDWPMLGRDKTRNPLSPEKNPPLWWAGGDRPEARKNIKWTVALGTRTKGDPVVAGGLIWIGTNNGAPRDTKVKTPAPVLMCFREKDGQFLYQYVTERPKINDYWEPQQSGHTSSPLAEGDRLWFTTMAAETVCLDIGPLRRGSGPPRELWKVDMRKDLGVIPAGETMGIAKTCSIAASYKDKIYVITAKGLDDEERIASPKAPSLVCFHKNTGKVIWQDNSPKKTMQDGEWASPLVLEIAGRGQVIAPQGDGWVRSFDAETGKLIWKFDTNPKGVTWGFSGTANAVLASPVYDGRCVYVGNGRNPILSGGAEAWLYCIDPTKKGDLSPEVDHGEGKTEANPNSGMIWRFGGRDIKAVKKGRRLLFGGLYTSVAVCDGLVIANEPSGYVHCLDARTGRRHWVHDVKSDLLSSPLIVDGRIFITTDVDVHILALAKEKQVLATIEMDAAVWTSPVFANGVLYLATDRTLYAIENRVPAPKGK